MLYPLSYEGVTYPATLPGGPATAGAGLRCDGPNMGCWEGGLTARAGSACARLGRSIRRHNPDAGRAMAKWAGLLGGVPRRCGSTATVTGVSEV